MFEDTTPKQPASPQQDTAEPADIFRDIAESSDNQYNAENLKSRPDSKSQLHIILYIVIGILSLLVIVLAVFLVVTKINKNTPQNTTATPQEQNQKNVPVVQNANPTTPSSIPPSVDANTKPQYVAPQNANTVIPQEQQKNKNEQLPPAVQNAVQNNQVPLQQDLDTDGDGLTEREEIKYGTDSLNPDTDGDGYKDGEEVKNGYNPMGPGKLIPQ